MRMLESTHGKQVCRYNHVIGLYTMLKISGIKNFNTPVSKYPNIRTFYYAYVLLFTRFVAMFITRIRLRRKYNVYRCSIYFPVLNVSVQCEAENGIAMTSKRKRVVLTIEEKYKIIKDGESATKLARIHGGWFDGLRM